MLKSATADVGSLALEHPIDLHSLRRESRLDHATHFPDLYAALQGKQQRLNVQTTQRRKDGALSGKVGSVRARSPKRRRGIEARRPNSASELAAVARVEVLGKVASVPDLTPWGTPWAVRPHLAGTPHAAFGDGRRPVQSIGGAVEFRGRPGRKRRRRPSDPRTGWRAAEQNQLELGRKLVPLVDEERVMRDRIHEQLIDMRGMLPMTFLFEHNLSYCRARMKKAVVDTVNRLLKVQMWMALEKWRAFVRTMRQEELAQRKAEVDRYRQRNGLEALAAIGRKLQGGKVRGFFGHWVAVLRRTIRHERYRGALGLQRLWRGVLGRRCAHSRRGEWEAERNAGIRAVRAIVFLEAIAQQKAHKCLVQARLDWTRRRNSVTLQCCVRGWLARQALARRRAAEIVRLRRVAAAQTCQRALRGGKARRHCAELRLQAKQRKRATREAVRNRIAALTDCQRVFRGHRARERYRRMVVEQEILNNAVRRVQRAYRISCGKYALHLKFQARRERMEWEWAQKRKWSAIMCQSCWRRYIATFVLARLRQENADLEAKRNAAASRLQTFWYRVTGNHAMAMRCEMRRVRKELENAAAITLQRVHRGARGRILVHRKRARLMGCLRVQNWYRFMRARHLLWRLRNARALLRNKSATVLQCAFRGVVARRSLRMLQEQKAAMVLQRCVRSAKARHKLQSLRKEHADKLAQLRLEWTSAKNVQRVFRGHRGRKLAGSVRRKRAATSIQTQLYRPWLARAVVRHERRVADRQREKARAALKWRVISRGRHAIRVQCRLRSFWARRELRERKASHRLCNALIIQRFARLVIAKSLLRRYKRHRAAAIIQCSYRHCTERYLLFVRFGLRRQRLDRELACATKLQSTWRMRKGRVSFKKERKKQRDEKLRLAYILERRRKAEEEKYEADILAAHAAARRKAVEEARAKARERALAKAREDQEDEVAYWAREMPNQSLIKDLEFQKEQQRKVDLAWVEKFDETQGGAKFFYNEITYESSWERPPGMPLPPPKEKVIDARPLWQRLPCSVCGFQSVGIHDEKTDSEGSEETRGLITVHTKAVTFCADCSLVFCASCSEKKHAAGEAANHFCVMIEDTDTTVCVKCERQLATRNCKQCADSFCSDCYMETHSKGVKASHVFENIERHQRPALKRGEEYCSECGKVAATRHCDQCKDLFCDNCYDEQHAKGRRKQHTYAPANELVTWKQMFDVKSSKYYYYNAHTSETSWEKPYQLMDEAEKAAHDASKARDAEALGVKGQEIAALQKDLDKLGEWKGKLEARRQKEEEAKAPIEFKQKNMWQRVTAKPKDVLLNPRAFMKSVEAASHRDQKYYLNQALMDKRKLNKIDASASATERKRAYKDGILSELTEQRYAIRQEMYRFTINQLTPKEFKKSVDAAKKLYEGPDGSKALAKRCKKAAIMYGPKVPDGPGKLNKQQAIEKLVLHEHQVEVQRKEQEELEREQQGK